MKLLYIHAFSAEWLAAHYIIKAYLMIVVGFFLDCFSEIIIFFKYIYFSFSLRLHCITIDCEALLSLRVCVSGGV